MSNSFVFYSLISFALPWPAHRGIAEAAQLMVPARPRLGPSCGPQVAASVAGSGVAEGAADDEGVNAGDTPERSR